MKRTRRAGFTLLELMIVIVCLAIVGLIVVPSSNDTGTRLISAGRQLIADLQYAQARSIGRGDDPCVVVFDTAMPGYHLAHASDPGVPLTHPVTHRPYAVRFGRGQAGFLRGVAYETVAVGADRTLTYTAAGALDSADDAAVTLRCGTSTLRIVIDAETGEPTAP